MNEKERALLDFSRRLKTIIDKAKQGKSADFASIKQDLDWVKQDYGRELGGIEECDPDVRKFGAALREAESLITQADPTTYL
jgi:hypothetical protein